MNDKRKNMLTVLKSFKSLKFSFIILFVSCNLLTFDIHH